MIQNYRLEYEMQKLLSTQSFTILFSLNNVQASEIMAESERV